jgi:ketopantoate reductase
MSTSQKPIDVLLFGLGAIGTVYAAILHENPRVRLSVCARSTFDIVSKNGITINRLSTGECNFKPHKVLRTPSDAGHTFDYIYIVNKAVNTESVLEQLKPAIDPEKTTISIMQNGVGNEDPFRKAFPKCTLLTGVVGIWTQHNDIEC